MKFLILCKTGLFSIGWFSCLSYTLLLSMKSKCTPSCFQGSLEGCLICEAYFTNQEINLCYLSCVANMIGKIIVELFSL